MCPLPTEVPSSIAMFPSQGQSISNDWPVESKYKGPAPHFSSGMFQRSTSCIQIDHWTLTKSHWNCFMDTSSSQPAAALSVSILSCFFFFIKDNTEWASSLAPSIDNRVQDDHVPAPWYIDILAKCFPLAFKALTTRPPITWQSLPLIDAPPLAIPPKIRVQCSVTL